MCLFDIHISFLTKYLFICFVHFLIGLLIFTVEFWEFFIYSRYRLFVRYVACKYFLPVCILFFSSFHWEVFLNFDETSLLIIFLFSPDTARKKWKFGIPTCAPLTLQLVGSSAAWLLDESRSLSSAHGLHWYHWGVWRGAPDYHWAVVKVQAPHWVSTDTTRGRLRRGTFLPLASAQSPNFPPDLFCYHLCRDRKERSPLLWVGVDAQAPRVVSIDSTVRVKVGLVREAALHCWVLLTV